MPYSSMTYDVMIASPSDVVEERNIIRDVLYEWNAVHARERSTVLLPVSRETHAAPVTGDRAQETINRQVLNNADLLIAVFWTRLGTPTGEAESGTVEEIQRHVGAKKPAMIYFSNRDIPRNSIDMKQNAALMVFKDWCKENSLYEDYESISEFGEKLQRQLMINVRDLFGNHGTDVYLLFRSLAGIYLPYSMGASEPQAKGYVEICYDGGNKLLTRCFIRGSQEQVWEGTLVMDRDIPELGHGSYRYLAKEKKYWGDHTINVNKYETTAITINVEDVNRCHGENKTNTLIWRKLSNDEARQVTQITTTSM